ncbi:hypothetical protein CA54_35580 [Symmachiella macrocystis]|uniref:Uncharacterized protein n=1 Tax=Symmachiella macrocystis TaxID=2527985 RepID=A0A5C6BVI6_9PLAN|nr:hypothetical protein CA54_35580 [Symmachiella macrocystis]
MDPSMILDKLFWLIAIAVTCLNAGIFRFK